MTRFKLDLHPLVFEDVYRIGRHVAESSGSEQAAQRRIQEIEELLDEIVETPLSGARLGKGLEGFIARHGGRDRRLTAVFRPDKAAQKVFVICVAFGGADWMKRVAERAYPLG